MRAVEILCLANSRKINGRCVAGLTSQGEWIRPVSGEGDGTLYQPQYVLESGDEATVLDVLDVRLYEHAPERHQPENWRVTDQRWQRTGHLSGEGALRFLRENCAPGPELLGNKSDRVSWERLGTAPAESSLALVEPRNLRWYITTSFRGYRQTRALFTLGDEGYDLSITDPIWEARLAGLAHGIQPLEAGGLTEKDNVFLTISLSEPLPNGYCFKLIAAIIALA